MTTMNKAASHYISSYHGISPLIADDVYVHPSAVIIGDVHIGTTSSVWPNTVIRGDVNHIRIGVGSNIQDGSVLHVNHKSSHDPQGSPLIIGDFVTVGHKVILHGCHIENECLIGMGSIVMDKVIIQKHVLLGAGSLVPEGKVLESGYLYLGSPAKKIRPLKESEIAYFMYSAEQYIALNQDFLREN